MEPVYADKLYEFLTEIAEAAKSRGDQQVAQSIDVAMKHYMIPLPTGKNFRLPLTSEFLGESMVALREALDKSRSLFSPEQASLAEEYVDSIKQQWFSR